MIGRICWTRTSNNFMDPRPKFRLKFDKTYEVSLNLGINTKETYDLKQV